MSNHAGLEAEREFLLRSLDDLDAERAAGNVDDETYRTLHDDYTARAAAVLRSLRDGVDQRPAPPPVSRGLRLMTISGVVIFVVVAAVALGRAIATREPGQAITGNDAASTSRLETLRVAAADRPDDYDARIAYARALLGEDQAEALRQYDAAARLDPTQPEPAAYAGWINGLAAGQLDPGPTRDALVQRSLSQLDHAVEMNPDYPDAHVFRALVRRNVLGDAEGAIPDLQLFLTLAPQDHPMRESVLQVLAQATAETTTTVAGP
jgi:tetratricopeptide (TPR) repeat protein